MNLSGGQQQRIAIAAVPLALDPEIHAVRRSRRRRSNSRNDQ